MKNTILVLLTCTIFCHYTIAQNNKKTSFRLLVGDNVTTRTHLSSITTIPLIIGPTGFSHFSYNEIKSSGFSVEGMVSFRLDKKWRLNTGLMLDQKGYAGKETDYFSIPTSAYYTSTTVKNAAIYLGIPLELERILFNTKHWSLSINAGLADQWKVSGKAGGDYFLNNQFTMLGGLYFSVPLHRIALTAHPIFRYSLTQLQDSYIGSIDVPHLNAYSVGLEVGINF